MDRDRRWERTHLAYDLLANGRADRRASDARSAVRDAYARGENDEFVLPTIVAQPRPIEDGDAFVFFNFRPDRARQLTTAFNAGTTIYFDDDFGAFTSKRYRQPILRHDDEVRRSVYEPGALRSAAAVDTFGEILARDGLRQLRLAETEKYAHVTYFFNGGREDQFDGEERILIPSDRSVPTYDLAPAMRAREITDAARAAIASGKYDAIVMNYANADMVGHTGTWQPTIEAVEMIDECLAPPHRCNAARGRPACDYGRSRQCRRGTRRAEQSDHRAHHESRAVRFGRKRSARNARKRRQVGRRRADAALDHGIAHPRTNDRQESLYARLAAFAKLRGITAPSGSFISLR